MRRAMPSRRVSIIHAAPLSELRKMNSSSWVLAPDSKRPPALAEWRRRAPSADLNRAVGTESAAARARERVAGGTSRGGWTSLRGGEHAALIVDHRLDGGPHRWASASGPREEADARRSRREQPAS